MIKGKISRETIISSTKVSSVIVVIYFAFVFNTGLTQLNDLPFQYSNFSSSITKSAFIVSEQPSKSFKTSINKFNLKLLKLIFCSKKEYNNESSNTNSNKKDNRRTSNLIDTIFVSDYCKSLMIYETPSCFIKNEDSRIEDICVDTVISLSNSIYFGLVFFLGAFINNKGIIKLGTL